MVSEEKAWNSARLIPTSGINGAEEQERRATSALLAVMSSVREFGRALTSPLGAPAAALDAFIEVPFDHGERRVFPDGLLRAKRGSRVWTALVEVKTGANELSAEQLETYLDIAKDHGFDSLVTISNEIPPAVGLHPTTVDKRKLRKVNLHHYSWTEILTQAVMQKEYKGVADPEQAWILGELIRYLEHPKSGAMSFEDMGASWISVRDAVAAGTLRPSDKGIVDVAGRFEALVRFCCLQLGRRLGAEVVPVLSRKESSDPSLRVQAVVTGLTDDGLLSAKVRIPNAVSSMTVTADLRAARITCHFDVDAPESGRPTTRVNWLIRQLRDTPDDTRIEAYALRSREGAAELLGDVREDPAKLIIDPGKEIRSFRVARSFRMGTKRGSGRGSFIESVLTAVDSTYADVGQRIKAWSASPPRIRSDEQLEVQQDVSEALVSASLSSQDAESAAPTE